MPRKKKPWLYLTVKDVSPTNQYLTPRNLQPQDLGAVIFGCTNNTFAECHTRQLFGLPKAHISYVRKIKEGLPLFLFNYDDRKLHGIYEAASNGKLCPQSNAWSHKGEKTGYPAQVAMRLKVWCFPLDENQFRNAILTNYYERMPGVHSNTRYFHFELDHAQTHALMNMFTPLPSPYNFPSAAAPVHEHVRQSMLPPVCVPEFEGNSNIKSKKAVKPYAYVVQKQNHEEAGYVGVNAEHATSNYQCSSGCNNLDCRETPLEGRDYVLLIKDTKVSRKKRQRENAKMQQLQSGQLDKNLSVVKLEKLKALSPQQHSSELCAKATARTDIDTYSCKDAQEVKSTILDGPPNLPEMFDAEVNQVSLGHFNPPAQSLDLKSCTEAKMNTGCTVVNELSPSPPAITHQFQESETQLTQAVYETPNNNNNGAPEATDPAGHPQSCCAKSMSIRPLPTLSSQDCMRDNSSPLAIQRCHSGHDEIHNKHPTELPSPDYIRWYVKDRLIGKITCMVCGEEGHYTCDCPMKDQENKVMCTRCKKVGHCYLWCCRQHVSENRACRRCGEKGHYINKDLSHCDEKYTNMNVRCASCDESHPLGKCPMGKVTCFLCEGKDHVPAHCRLSPLLTVTQCYRESFRAILKQALTETSRRAVTPAKLSTELEPHDDSHEDQFKRNDKMVHKVSSFTRCEQGDCEKNATISVPDSDETNHAALVEKALTLGSSSACFNCHEEGNYAHQYPKKKPPEEQEIGEVTCFNCHEEGHYANRCHKKKPPEEQEIGEVTCFNCHEEGHYANRCPKKKPPEEQELGEVTYFRFRAKKCHKKKSAKLELSDVTCFICQDKGHYSYSCPANKSPGGLELHDVTCINFDASTDWKKPPGELLCDVATCFKCHDKGHYSYSCPKNKTPGQGQNAKSCPKKKRKKEQQI